MTNINKTQNVSVERQQQCRESINKLKAECKDSSSIFGDKKSCENAMEELMGACLKGVFESESQNKELNNFENKKDSPYCSQVCVDYGDGKCGSPCNPPKGYRVNPEYNGKINIVDEE